MWKEKSRKEKGLECGAKHCEGKSTQWKAVKKDEENSIVFVEANIESK